MDDEQFDIHLYNFRGSINAWVEVEKSKIFNSYMSFSTHGKIEILKTLSKEFIRSSDNIFYTSVLVILSTRIYDNNLYNRISDNVVDGYDVISYENISRKIAEDILYHILLREILPGEYEKINKYDDVPF